MFAQLGNIIFDKQYTPLAMPRSTEANYVQHELINIKPRLQPTGNNLEEIELSIELRAEAVNIPNTLAGLHTSRSSFEVLPLVMGTGQYLGDFVITKMEENILHCMADGYPIAVAVSLSLKEYVIADRLAQQQNNDRKNAFAVGDITPSRLPPVPKATPQQITSKELAMAGSHTITADSITRQFENNVSAQQSLSDKLAKTVDKLKARLATANDTLNKINDNSYTDIIGSIGAVGSVLNGFTFPITSLSDLKFNNSQLQAAMVTLKKNSTILNNNVITRRA